MTLELVSIPLALLAGALGILSPCVWPLVPVVISSTATGGKRGALMLALGLGASFAVAGTALTFLLLNLGLDPVLFRYVAAVLLLVVGTTLIAKPLADWLTLKLSLLTGRLEIGGGSGTGAAAQFVVGALLGLVWLPCIGPTLGAAVALASIGQDMVMAFIVMFAFGIGTAGMLLIAGLLSGAALNRMRPGLLQGAERGKRLLGWLLLILGIMVLSGIDKVLEAWALSILPEWALNF